MEEARSIGLGTVILLIALALIFDFSNGFRDAANSIATVVSTRVLRPGQAVLLAAFFNFAALFVFGPQIATTVGASIVEQAIVDQYVVSSALVGALAWNLITWYYGIPSSSTHALIGGIIGAGLAKGGISALMAPAVLKIVAFIFLSPAIAFLLSASAMLAIAWMLGRSAPSSVGRWFRWLQLISISAYSMGHGSNDAQKTAGLIWMLLLAGGYARAQDAFPFWVAVLCYATIALATLFGGWRIVKARGPRITKLKPVGGFCAETGSAITLFTTAILGIPVSTTHTITGAIVGVGAMQNVRAVRWGVAGPIVWAWVLTIPCSAFIAGSAWWITNLILSS